MLDFPLNLCPNGRKFWGWFLLVIGSFSFVGFVYAAVISKLLPPSSYVFVSAIQNDMNVSTYQLDDHKLVSELLELVDENVDPSLEIIGYYCFLVPSTLVYFHWLGMKLFEHA